MGCQHNDQDSIEHYAACPIIAEVAYERLKLQQPISFQNKMENMLGINTQDTAETRVRRQCLTAAVYRLHNLHRHTPMHLNTRGMKDALAQALKDVVAGHRSAEKCMATAWARPQVQGRGR